MKIIAVCGNYRKDGVTERLMTAAAEGARNAGATVEILTLRDIKFDFCRNCKACWDAANRNQPPDNCPIRDDLTPWIGRLAEADGLILAAPVNFGSLTALFKKFQERCLALTELKPLPGILQCLAGIPAIPVPRRHGKPRPMICITASGATTGMGRLMMPCPLKQFRMFGGTWGGRITEFIWAGGCMNANASPSTRHLEKARAAGNGMATNQRETGLPR